MASASDYLPFTSDGINFIPFVMVLILGVFTVLWVSLCTFVIDTVLSS